MVHFDISLSLSLLFHASRTARSWFLPRVEQYFSTTLGRYFGGEILAGGCSSGRCTFGTHEKGVECRTHSTGEERQWISAVFVAPSSRDIDTPRLAAWPISLRNEGTLGGRFLEITREGLYDIFRWSDLSFVIQGWRCYWGWLRYKCEILGF